ncbi:MAG: hypothetical protein KDA61_04545, partial [Planctomycetales bacterium]|nr:hypothetical protein [Planctomycetales bacterium]
MLFLRIYLWAGARFGGALRKIRKAALQASAAVGTGLTLAVVAGVARAQAAGQLDESPCARYAANFNAMEDEPVVNAISNAEAAAWMASQIPLLDVPAKSLEETYYYRWWSFRKHIKRTPQGRVITEFITPVSHAGKYNTIACAVGHHIAEATWLRDQTLLDEYVRFWFRGGDEGGSVAHFHKFSSWIPAALYQRSLATGDEQFPLELLDDLVADYRRWEDERKLPSGLFWQHDVKDGMEESISGGRRVKNVRPTINSYMAANARAIADFAQAAGRDELAREFGDLGDSLRRQMVDRLWDADAGFFKVRLEDGSFSDCREAIGFIPWMFDLADEEQSVAWRQVTDRGGFWAPRGLTTAERRDPRFRSHGTGTCEWDGAVWPFATSQTLTGLARHLQQVDEPAVPRRTFFDQLLTYADAHQRDGKRYLGEYHDEITGAWLIPEPKAQRSRYYNHSTFADLVIRGLAGLQPQVDESFVVDPLVPAGAWHWF